MITDYIDPLVFLIALCVGLFYTYLATPSPTIVIKYPTPDNAGKITYVDDAGVCYKYHVKEVNCPTDKSKIKVVPVQEFVPQPTFKTKQDKEQEKTKAAVEAAARPWWKVW